MKFYLKYFYKTALHMAVENGNVDVAQLLLKNEKLNVNILYV